MFGIVLQLFGIKIVYSQHMQLPESSLNRCGVRVLNSKQESLIHFQLLRNSRRNSFSSVITSLGNYVALNSITKFQGPINAHFNNIPTENSIVDNKICEIVNLLA